MALATAMGLQRSWAALAEKAVPSHGEQILSLPHLFSISQGASDNTVDNIFCSPSSLHCQRHWDAHSRSQRKPTPCRAGKTCARHQAEDKLHRCSVLKHKGKALCSDVPSASQTQVFKDVRVVVIQGEIGSSMS